MNDTASASENGSAGDTKAPVARLTPAMRGVLWVVAGLAIATLIAAAWLLGVDRDAAPAPTSSPAPTAGPLPGATPTSGSEVQDPTAAPTDPDRLPPRTPATPLVAPPLPEPGSAQGELVDGFPADVMGPAPDSDIVSSAIATEGGTMQVTLVARTDAAADAIVAHYRDLWSELGLIVQAPTGQDGTSASGRGSTLTLAFSGGSGTGTVYTILATFRTD